jgi:hypothetical protein
MQRRTKGRYFAGLSRNTFLLAFASLFADISTEMLYPDESERGGAADSGERPGNQHNGHVTLLGGLVETAWARASAQATREVQCRSRSLGRL